MGELVLGSEIEGGEVVIEEIVVDDVGGFLQHGGDVAEVFLRAAFAEEFEFADDEVFRGGEGDLEAIDIDDFHVFHSPLVERITGYEIDIRLEQAVLADDVEMATDSPDNFGGDDIGRREVKIGFGESFDEAGDVGDLDLEDEVDIVGKAWFSVGHGGDGAGDCVGQAGGDERPNEGVDQFNHGGEESGG